MLSTISINSSIIMDTLLLLPELLFVRMANFLCMTCLVLSILFYMGWIKRAVWLWVQHDVSKNVLNGTPLTFGSVDFDLLRGTAVLTNVVIHQSQQEEWNWCSPLLARVGYAHVEFSFWDLLKNMILERELPGQSPRSGIDLYSIELSDIQVFIERRSYVFNFYLCDASLELPSPNEIQQQQQAETRGTTESFLNGLEHNNNDITLQEMDSDHDDNDDDNETSSNDDETTRMHAEEIVNKMFSAVNSLGRAAQRGSLKGALLKHRRTFTSKLRELKDNKEKVNALVEGSKVIRHVSKAVVKKTQTVGGVLPAVPKRRESVEEVPPLYVRVGRIHLRDLRIFTMDNWQESSSNTSTNQQQGENWNKPITIEEVTIRSAELCPPMSLLDDSSEKELPAIYQPIDKLMDVILKRILAETAKTNTGRLFKTAMGEVLGIIKSSSSGKQPLLRRHSSVTSEESNEDLRAL